MFSGFKSVCVRCMAWQNVKQASICMPKLRTVATCVEGVTHASKGCNVRPLGWWYRKRIQVIAFHKVVQASAQQWEHHANVSMIFKKMVHDNAMVDAWCNISGTIAASTV